MVVSFSFPTNILFGPQSLAQLPERIKQLGCGRPLLVTDRGVAGAEPFQAVQRISGDPCARFTDVSANPAEADVRSAAEAYLAGRCDCVIALGGGSVLDVGKALRLLIKRPDKSLGQFDYEYPWKPLSPFIAIPTTAGTGSEVGRSSVIILNGKKSVMFHPALLADLVILDPQLTTGLPAGLTAATGADALTHCIEAYTSPVFHPLCEAIALDGIRIIAEFLPRAVKDGHDLEARGRMLIAAMMGGIAFQKDLGAVHSLAHPLSSICHLHHGTANALCLPAVMQFNSQRKPGLYRRVGEAMGIKEPDDALTLAAIQLLLTEIGLKMGLRAHGVKDSQLDALADQAFEDGCHPTNAVLVTRDDLHRLYQAAM